MLSPRCKIPTDFFYFILRPGLSVSLNFRPVHECSSLRLHWNALLVSLGLRDSVAATLRALILGKVDPYAKRRLNDGDDEDDQQSTSVLLLRRAATFSRTTSAPCYVVMCDGAHAVVIEKDVHCGRIRLPSSANFVAQTNHDVGGPISGLLSGNRLGLDDNWLVESGSRLTHIEERWKTCVSRSAPPRRPQRNLRKRRLALLGIKAAPVEGAVAETRPVAVAEEELQNWLREFPISNECTHFRTVMDPSTGEIRWLQGVYAEDSDSEPNSESTLEA